MEILLAIMPPLEAAARYVAQGTADTGVTDIGIKYIAAGIAMGLGAFGPALAIGNLVGRALEALGRHPAGRARSGARPRQQARADAEGLLARARGEIQLERDSAIAHLRREF